MTSYKDLDDIGLDDDDREKIRRAAQENPHKRPEILSDEGLREQQRELRVPARSKNEIWSAAKELERFTISDIIESTNFTRTTAYTRVNELRARGWVELVEKDGLRNIYEVTEASESGEIREKLDDASGYGDGGFGEDTYGTEPSDDEPRGLAPHVSDEDIKIELATQKYIEKPEFVNTKELAERFDISTMEMGRRLGQLDCVEKWSRSAWRITL